MTSYNEINGIYANENKHLLQDILRKEWGYKRSGEIDEVMKKDALELAASADVVLYFFGLDELSESEGLDRSHMRIPQNQIDLLESIVKVNPNVVGIMSAGSAVEMPWHYCCRAILHGYLNGQAGATTIMDILTGKLAQCINFPLQRNITFKSKGNPAYQAMWYFIAWVIISLICNGFNNLWMPIAAVYVAPAIYNLLVTFITGGVSMVIFFFVFKVIFPEGEASGQK